LEERQRIPYRGDHNATYKIRHWRTGDIIATAPSSPHIAHRFVQARTHRVPLLNVLLSNVPNGIIQYNRSVIDHQVTEDGVCLMFDDSSFQHFDLLVAADGLYSVSQFSPRGQ
jgi:salicylate hydroxylase